MSAEDRVHDRIEELVSEEHALWSRESSGTATEADRERLVVVRASLDQCWNLLRRRRAFDHTDEGDPAAISSAEGAIEPATE